MGTSAPPPRQSYTLPPGKYEAAVAFNRQLDTLHFVGVLWVMLVLWILARRWKPQRWIAVPLLVAVPWLVSWPLSVWRHYLGLSYGLSVERWAPWLWDWFQAGLITTMVTAALVLGGIAFARRFPRHWWIWAWGFTVAFMIAATYLVPLAFDPLFHHFTPLSRTHPELIEPIQAVAARSGEPVPPERIYEMDASEKTRTLNAYMTGFGSTKRIVIWDTTIRLLTPPQIQTVFAHELGHYALHHIPRSIALAAVGLLVLFWFARSVRIAYDAMPRLILMVTLAGFLSEPIVNTYSRWQEHEADVYELQIMRSLTANPGANSADVDQIMAEISLDDPAPSPFIEFWLYDHPSTGDRIHFARAFDSLR